MGFAQGTPGGHQDALNNLWSFGSQKPEVSGHHGAIPGTGRDPGHQPEMICLQSAGQRHNRGVTPPGSSYSVPQCLICEMGTITVPTLQASSKGCNFLIGVRELHL